MKELIERIKGISNLSELDNYNNLDSNVLFLAILKSERYELLKDCNIKLHIDNDRTSIKLIDYLLSDEDILFYMQLNGYFFSKEDLNQIFKIVCKYQDTYKFDRFFRSFLLTKKR